MPLFRDYVRDKVGQQVGRDVEEHLRDCQSCAEIIDLIEFREMSKFLPRSAAANTSTDLNSLLCRLRELPQESN